MKLFSADTLQDWVFNLKRKQMTHEVMAYPHFAPKNTLQPWERFASKWHGTHHVCSVFLDIL